MVPAWFAALVLGVPLPARAQGNVDVERVEGTVRDEQGNPIAGAIVQLVPCSRTAAPVVLAIELIDAPLPSTRTSATGAWSLLLAPVHQRLHLDLHGAFALVVEAPGFQPWRELLPSPVGLYDGSDVVLPRRQASDDARIVVPDAPAGAIVRVQRRPDREFPTVLDRVTEWIDLPVPADGQLVVNAPTLPCPLVLASNDRGAFAGWTAQLLTPGHSTAREPIAPGQTLRLAPTAPRPPKPAEPATGAALAASRLLATMPDGSVRWFPAVGGGIPEDPMLPIAAVQRGEAADARIVAWPDAIKAPITAVAPTRLRFRGPIGTAIDQVIVDWCAPEALQAFVDVGLRPHRQLHRQRLAASELAVDATTRTPCAWVTAPGHLPRFVLDVRNLPSTDGTATIELAPVERELTMVVRDDQGNPLAGAVACVFHRVGDDPLRTFRNGPLLAADGSPPRTDANGLCRVPMTAEWADATVLMPGHRCRCEAVDAANQTMPVTAYRQTAWPVHSVNEARQPQPFTNLGCSIMTPMEGGGSMGTVIAVCTDSRGRATLLTDTRDAPPPQLAPAVLGALPETGTPLRAGAATTLAVATEPLVVVRLPANPLHRTRGLLRWRRQRPGLPLGSESVTLPHTGAHYWFRWPSELELWIHDAPHDPPAVITVDAVNGPRVEVDATKAARLLPLRLDGAVPDDLTPLRVVPKAIDGVLVDKLFPLGGEYLAKDRTTLRLQTADALAHTVVLLHPELVPSTVQIPRGDEARSAVTAKVEPGAPCSLVLPPAAPRFQGERVFLTARIGWRVLTAVELFEPRLYTEAARAGIEMPAPFALPVGRIELQLSTGGSCQVQVADTQPVRAQFSPR